MCQYEETVQSTALKVFNEKYSGLFLHKSIFKCLNKGKDYEENPHDGFTLSVFSGYDTMTFEAFEAL